MKSCKRRQSDLWKNHPVQVKHYQKCKATGKIRYDDKLDAMMVLAKAKSTKASAKRNECRYYLCPFCNGWHLTSHPDKFNIPHVSGVHPRS